MLKFYVVIEQRGATKYY